MVETVLKIEAKLNSQLLNVSTWFARNKLSLNYKKSNFMLFSSNPTKIMHAEYHIEAMGNSISGVNKYKYLSVILDSRLSFSEHITYIKGKTLSKLKMLSRVRPAIDRKSAFSLYVSLIQPLFDYCDVVYDGLSQQDSQKLQKLQNIAMHFILQCEPRTRTKEMQDELELDSLVVRRWKHTCHEMFKIYNAISPQYLTK